MGVLDSTSKKISTLVELSYGDPITYKRFSDQNDDITWNFAEWSPFPTMRITYPEFTGGLSEKSLKLETKDADIFSEIAKDEAWPDTDINIYELFENEAGATIDRHRFSGCFCVSSKNAKNTKGLLEFQCESLKQDLEKPVGMIATHQCNNRWGGPTCGFPLDLHEQLITISSVSRTKIVTLTSPVRSATSAPFNDEFRKGFFRYNGLDLTVRDWAHTDPTTFYTTRTAPMSWVGKAIKLFPGCDFTLSHCQRWGREAKFTAIGIATPARYPPVEGEIVVGSPEQE